MRTFVLCPDRNLQIWLVRSLDVDQVLQNDLRSMSVKYMSRLSIIAARYNSGCCSSKESMPLERLPADLCYDGTCGHCVNCVFLSFFFWISATLLAKKVLNMYGGVFI